MSTISGGQVAADPQCFTRVLGTPISMVMGHAHPGSAYMGKYHRRININTPITLPTNVAKTLGTSI